MTTTSPQRIEHRTYGGWRLARGIGLLGLGLVETLVVLGIVLVVLIAAAFSLLLAAIVAVPSVLVIASLLLRVGGVSIAHALIGRIRWWVGVWRGQDSYRAGIVIDHPRAFQLPGVLAPLALISAEDGFGGTYGLVYDRRAGTLTATVRIAAASTWLADPDDADGWVANWGNWLASLGYQPLITHVAVTVDTAPDPGSTLRDHIRQRLSPTAPAPARSIINDLVAASPAAAADVDTRVSITFDPARAAVKPRSLSDAAAEVGRILTGLQTQLASCGVTVLGRATAAELAGAIRTAFDPASRGEVNHLLSGGPTRAEQLLTWANAGPVGAKEHHDQYEHDSGISVTWGWHEAPRQYVNAAVLTPLIAPGIHPKRITLLYRPYSVGEAARIAEQEKSGAQFRERLAARSGKDPTARDTTDTQHANRQAAEEAAGAGICRVSLWVTVTVTHPEDLPVAVADVEARADAAKIQLRRLYRSQAAGFATTLPAGICPPTLSARWPH